MFGKSATWLPTFVNSIHLKGGFGSLSSFKGGIMYDRFIFPTRRKCLVWYFIFCCFSFWNFSGVEGLASDRFDTVHDFSAGFTPVSSASEAPSVGSYFTAGSPYQNLNYIVTAVSSPYRGGIYTFPQTNTVSIGHSGYRIDKISYAYYAYHTDGLYRRFSFYCTVAVSPTPPNAPIDSDGDGIKDDVDPCPDSPDDNYTVYRAKNMCTGSYYFYQITGDCGETNTFHNPIYNSLASALDDSLANPDCSPPESFQSVNMNAQDFENWYNSNFDTQSTADGSLDNQNIPDPTGGNQTINVPPKQVDASDPDNQKIIDQIERMKVAVENVVRASGEKVSSQVEISGKEIIGGLKGVRDAIGGISFAGVSNAIGSASGTAHNDATALLNKLGAIETAIGNSGGNSSTTVNAMSKEEMDASLLLDRQETYKVEDGGFGPSLDDSQQGLVNKITSAADNVKNRVLNIIPSYTVETDSITACIPASSSVISGFTVEIPEICLDPWENYFVMLGNVLYAVAGIGCVLTIFGFRG